MSETNERLSKQSLIEGVKTRFTGERPKLTQADVAAVINAFMETVREEVAAGRTVPLPGFGSFEARTRAERRGRHPRTGEALSVPARSQVRFKVAAPFRARLNGGSSD